MAAPAQAARSHAAPALAPQAPQAQEAAVAAPPVAPEPGLKLSRTEALALLPEPEPEASAPVAAPDELIERGRASWYGRRFQGRRTASGEPFDMRELTAAHKTLPFGTKVRVRSLRNGREVVVRINDRGPFTKGRVIDLSRAAIKALGLSARGVIQVELLRE
jgi:rare lipoprotein A